MEKHIFIIDDEQKVCEVIGETLEESGFKISCFSSPAECIAKLHSEKNCHLLIADLKMPEENGIELLEEVKQIAPWIPVLIITGCGDVPSAVKAIKAGAEDFIEKPLDKRNFAKKIRSILENETLYIPELGDSLTPAETKILQLVVNGKSNREIADMLGRSVRTVEVHRAHIMQKLGVNKICDLIKRAVSMGIIDIK